MLLITLLACHRGDEGALTVYATAEHAAPIQDFLDTIGDDRIVVDEVDDPVSKVGRRGAGVRVALEHTGEGGEGYEISAADHGYVVRAGARLGLEHGLSALLEGMGYRFPHPVLSLTPDALVEPGPDVLGASAPEMARRGLHLHTLHPIEGLYALWTGESPELAAPILDWVVRNRGDHVQWVALDDITDSSDRREAWREQTGALVDLAHERGLSAGLGIQLFGSGNLQNAFDLLDSPSTPERDQAAIDERLDQIDGIDWDVLNLSFGEFSGEDPETFIAAVDRAGASIAARWPEADVPAVVHVGNYEDLWVEYQGESLLYYFLVKFAQPPVYPWVHSVMYYNLFEDAGGAYHHDEFTEHREFLLDRLEKGERVGYMPESAYWIAFDDSVPTYLPVYMRSRWTDLDRVRAEANAGGYADLDEHVLFSTGWEWGYWQTDAATLRYGWTLPTDWSQPLSDFFSPWGEEGAALVAAVVAAADAQHAGLIEARLAPYLAGRDLYIDLGDGLGIHSQPDRPEFSEVLAYDEATRVAFVREVLEPLDELASALAEASAAADAVDLDIAPAQEIQDGLAVTALRARFIHSLYTAVVTTAEGGGEGEGVDVANLAYAEAMAIVAHRHADLYAGLDGRLVSQDDDNPTIYPFGYLAAADGLCFWRRELAQIENTLRGGDEDEPSCI